MEMDAILYAKYNSIMLVVVPLLYVNNLAIMEYLISLLNNNVIMEY